MAADTAAPPTFMAYHRAMQQSPEQLDALLTHHGRALLRRSGDEAAPALAGTIRQ